MKDANLHRSLAIVTEASNGMGLELARIFASDGYDLAVVAKDEGIFNLESELKSTGAQVEAFQFDLAKFAGVEGFMDEIENLDRSVGAIVLNAGVGFVGDGFRGAFLDTELDLIHLNVVSMVHLVKLITDKRILGADGKILFTSVLNETLPHPLEVVYEASNAFLQSFALGLREELRDSGITVTTFLSSPIQNPSPETERMTAKIEIPSQAEMAAMARKGYEAFTAGHPQVFAASPRPLGRSEFRASSREF